MKKSLLLLCLLPFLFSYITIKAQQKSIYDEGLKQYHDKQYDNAIKSFTKVILDNPNTTEAWYNRGLSYYAL